MLSDEELSEIVHVVTEEDEPGIGLLDRATCLALLADLRSLREERDDLQHDLGLMMETRQVLDDGIGKVLLAFGHYLDCQERGPFVDGYYSIDRAVQDALDAARSARVTYNRLMDAAAPTEEGKTYA